MIENEVKKYDLDFEKTIAYFLKHIDWGTSLSKKMVEKINFNNGFFFTFQPINADKQKLYNLNSGGILPQQEPIRLPKFSKSIFVPIPDIVPNIADYIFTFLNTNEKRLMIFENFEARPQDKYLNWEDENLIKKDNEIYYILKKILLLSK